ncbi:MAG: hypothetical protein IKU00_10765 [Bacteroidales bacterium]|nr:hypothetical protein [Bacteroidales bacterium]
MKRRLHFLYFLCFSLLFGLPFTSMAQYSELQTLVDPLTVSGTVGTQITSSWNNADLHYNSPFSTVAYANMTFNAYGISIPMSVNLINVSAEQFAFSRPSFTMNFRPTWKKFTFYFGTAAMNFSNYTYNGISFDGVGMEYKGNKFRFGGFYGNFNHATTFRIELDDRDAIQYLSDSLLGLNNVAYTTFPQFERKAYAAHVAVGSMRNYVDFSVLHAADDLNSLPSEWYMYNVFSSNVVDTALIVRDSTIKGKENLALGLKGHFTIGKSVMFEANLGASLFTPDITREEIVLEGGDDVELANRLMGRLRNSGLYNIRYGSEVRFAGDALLNLNFKPVSATLTYRFVQPDYTSLGANGFNQNAQTFGGNFSTYLLENTAFLNLNGYLQRDNLDKKQLFTNQVGSYSVNWTNYFGDNIALGFMYNAVTQKQSDGVMVVPEPVRINQIARSLDISPSYTLSLDNDHTFGVNFNLLQNKNRNKKMEGVSFDVTTTSFGAGYEVYLTGSRISLDANYDYSLSRSVGNDYNSHCLSGGITNIFIEKENLTLTGNARLTMAYNVEKSEAEELSDTEKQVLRYLAHRTGAEAGTEMTNDLSLAARLGTSLTYKDRHNASLYFSISNYSDNIIIGQHIAVNTDVRLMLEYSYSFASRLIKSKKSKK